MSSVWTKLLAQDFVQLVASGNLATLSKYMNAVKAESVYGPLVTPFGASAACAGADTTPRTMTADATNATAYLVDHMILFPLFPFVGFGFPKREPTFLSDIIIAA